MVSIDKLCFEDLAGLKSLCEDAFDGSVSNYEKMVELFKRVKDDPNHLVLCAKVDGKVVGSVLGIVCNEFFGQCTPFMVLEDVAVLSSHRRMGIARKLLSEIESQAKQKECSMILFVSSKHRHGAHKLYESLGYGADEVNGYRKRIV